MLRRVIHSVGLVLTAFAVLRGAPAASGGEATHWKGTIELPGGTALDFSVALSEESGAISIPMQGAKDVPLRDVSFEAESMKFTLAPPGVGDKAWARFDLSIADDGASAEGTMTQAGKAFPARMNRSTVEEIAAAGSRPQTPVPPFPYEERAVEIKNGAITLAGTLTVPQGAGPHPAVVMMTGSGAQDRDETIFGHKAFMVWADALARHGVAALRMDDRGVGGSTGNLMLATEEDIASDGAAGARYLLAQPGIDPARLGVLGHSEGAALAPLVANLVPEVKFVVMLAGYAMPGHELLTTQSIEILRGERVKDEAALDRVRAAHQAAMRAVMSGAPHEEGIRLIGELTRAQLSALGQPIDDEEIKRQAGSQYAGLLSPWFRSFLVFDSAAALKRVRVPVLAVFGERDRQVPPRSCAPGVRSALEEAGNVDFAIIEMPGLNHLLQTCETGTMAEYAKINETINPAALERVVEWIREKAGVN